MYVVVIISNRQIIWKKIVNVMQPMQVLDPIFQQQMVLGGGSNTEEGTKIYISNLDYGVSNDDIQVETLIDFVPQVFFHQ